MKKMMSALISALTFVVLLSSLAVPAFAFTPTATAPEWTEGTQWGYGAETNVGAEFDGLLDNLTDMLEMTDEVESVNELSLDGETGFWMLFEVTDVTDDTYVMSMDMAAKFTLDAAVSITADLDKTGVYNIADDPDTEEITVTAEISAEAILVVNVEITYEKDSMAIKSIVIEAKLTAAIDFVAENIPSSEEDFMNNTREIWYEDYDVSGDLEGNLGLNLAFEPALNLLEFPLYVDKIWNVTSVATLSGSLTGSLDVQGLPEEMKENIFTEEFIDEIGVSDFPIVFEDIDDMGEIPFDNGVIEETTTPELDMKMKCTDYFFLGDVGVYEIRVGSVDSPMVFYYSSEVGFMNSFSLDTEEINEDVADYIPSDLTTMASVDPAVAEENINEIADLQDDVGGDGGVAGFFTEAPYLGLILIGVIVVVVVAAVMLMRKKK